MTKSLQDKIVDKLHALAELQRNLLHANKKLEHFTQLDSPSNRLNSVWNNKDPDEYVHFSASKGAEKQTLDTNCFYISKNRITPGFIGGIDINGGNLEEGASEEDNKHFLSVPIKETSLRAIDDAAKKFVADYMKNYIGKGETLNMLVAGVAAAQKGKA